MFWIEGAGREQRKRKPTKSEPQGARSGLADVESAEPWILVWVGASISHWIWRTEGGRSGQERNHPGDGVLLCGAFLTGPDDAAAGSGAVGSRFGHKTDFFDAA